MRVTPNGVAVPTAGFANANVGFPDGLAHQDSGERGVRIGKFVARVKSHTSNRHRHRSEFDTAATNELISISTSRSSGDRLGLCSRRWPKILN
jgi:hypothetical protein